MCLLCVESVGTNEMKRTNLERKIYFLLRSFRTTRDVKLLKLVGFFFGCLFEMQMFQLTKHCVDLLKRADQRTSSPTWSLSSGWLCLKCRFSATEGNGAVTSLINVVATSLSLAVFSHFVNLIWLNPNVSVI